ncbi:hypothetical protein MMC14_006757 [Varicellaria rhodocarpa]|nr:hypothetical protein [Varicellaria rhodocarpa]
MAGNFKKALQGMTIPKFEKENEGILIPSKAFAQQATSFHFNHSINTNSQNSNVERRNKDHYKNSAPNSHKLQS